MRRVLAPGWTVALLLAGCVAAPPRVTPRTDVEPPAEWTTPTPTSAPTETDWWSELGGAELRRLIELALERNHDLRAAAARVGRATAAARIAGAELEPSVGVALGGARQRQNFVGFPFGGGSGVLSTISDRFQLSLDTSWEVDLWGRLRAGARAALAEAQAADADLAAARLSIAGQTARLWFAVVEARQQVELTRRSSESFGRLAEQVRSRYEAGLRPAVELRLALSNRAAAEALLELRREELDRRTRQIEVLLGRYPSATLLESFPAGELPDPGDAPPAGLPAELVSRRPDLVAAERRLAATDERVRQARRALYPRLSLTGGGGTVSDELRDLLDGDFRVWSLIGNLLQPLFQGGRLRANVDLAEALGDEALAVYAGAVLRAFGEVEAALHGEELLRRRAAHVSENVRQLTAARDLAEQRYREGLGDYLTVLESQTRALAAEGEQIGLRRALLDNRIALYLALGGGFVAPPAAGPLARSSAAGEDEDPAP